MGATRTPSVKYRVSLILEDAAGKGWNQSRLAAEAGLPVSSVNNFVSGKHQTPRTAGLIAGALGHSVGRYIVPAEQAVAS
jgi:transcriptional regulator with XRE-family HTH domain